MNFKTSLLKGTTLSESFKVSCLRIEEKHRSDNKTNVGSSKVNLVESSKNHNFSTINQEEETLRKTLEATAIPQNKNAKDCHFRKTQVYKPRSTPNKDQRGQSNQGQRAKVNMLVDQEESSEPTFGYESNSLNFVYHNKDCFKTYQNSSGGSVTLGNNYIAQA